MCLPTLHWGARKGEKWREITKVYWGSSVSICLVPPQVLLCLSFPKRNALVPPVKWAEGAPWGCTCLCGSSPLVWGRKEQVFRHSGAQFERDWPDTVSQAQVLAEGTASKIEVPGVTSPGSAGKLNSDKHLFKCIKGTSMAYYYCSSFWSTQRRSQHGLGSLCVLRQLSMGHLYVFLCCWFGFH